MKLPNGFGSVYKLSGNRRNPWIAKKTDKWEVDPVTLKAKQKYIIIGYYPTRTAAIKALSAFNENPYDVNATKITLQEIYDKWSDKKFEEISQSNVTGYKAAWKLLEPIKDYKISEITIDHLQDVVDTSGKNTPTLRKLKVLLKALYDYAVIRGYISKDRHLIEYLNINKAGNPNSYKHTIFTENEIKKLWKYEHENQYISIILMMIYSGVRISELLDLKKEDVFLEERYFNIVSSKTDAGIRSVPINHKILPFFQSWYSKNDSEFLLSMENNQKFLYRNFYDAYWKPTLFSLGMTHRPHDTRHTCISLMATAKIDERFIQAIVGHKGQNVTRQVYTHLEIKELLTEIDKI